MDGLAIEGPKGPVRLKWHRLRRHPQECEFDPANLARGLKLGASMEIDLQRAAEGFVVLHDTDLSGETLGTGPVAGASEAALRATRLRQAPRAPLLDTDLAALLGAAHPQALLQFDMKNELAQVGAAGVSRLARLFAPHAGLLIASGVSEELIAAMARAIPGLKAGYDPTDALIALERPAAMEKRLLACLRQEVKPAMVYLQWEMLLGSAALGLDMVALAHAEGVAVDAWTHAMKRPEAGFSAEEADLFAALLALGPDQITTDAPVATEAACRKIGLLSA